MSAVPVFIEFIGYIRHNRSNCHGIEIGKRNILVCVKIFIADISTTDNRDLIVHCVGFAVHAVIQSLYMGDELEILGMSAHKGIIQPYFHVGMCVQG